MHEAAGVAEQCVNAAHARRRIGREEVPHVDVAGEEPVVEDTQVLLDALLRGTPDRAPAGDAALAALDERQVDRGLVGLEIVRVPQAARLVGPRLAESAHHPPELAYPEMQPDLEEGTKLPRIGRPPGVVHPHGQVVTREQGATDDRAAEEFVDALPDLADDCVGLEGLIEDGRYVVEQFLAALFVSNRGRGAGADQSLAGYPEPRAKPSDEVRQLGALGAVECVQLVHHQVTQGVRGIVAPEPVVDRPEGVQSVCTHPYQRRNNSFRGKQPSDICRKNHLRRHRAWSSDQRRVLESSVAASRVTAPPTTLNALPVRLHAEIGSAASPLE